MRVRASGNVCLCFYVRLCISLCVIVCVWGDASVPGFVSVCSYVSVFAFRYQLV